MAAETHPLNLIRFAPAEGSDWMGRFWEQVRTIFENDDGSLPSVLIDSLSTREVRAIYRRIRSFAGPAKQGDKPATVWSEDEQAEVLIDQLEDLIALLERDNASASFVLDDVVYQEQSMPILGISVTSAEIDVNYRMGKEWNEARSLLFFSLLHELAMLVDDPRVRPGREMLPDAEKVFMTAWQDISKPRIPRENLK